MKGDALFKRTYNELLRMLEALPLRADIGSEPYWAARVGVSRTTLRKALQKLESGGVIAIEGRRKSLLRRPRKRDFFRDGETRPVGELVEKEFMHWILHGDCRPGQQINGLELARQFGVSASAVRDYLARFSRYGLLRRRPSGSWVFGGFTREFAEELFEIRFMFELRSVERFLELERDDTRWSALDRIRDEHLALRSNAERRYRDFSELDERFHRLINDASRNRFVVSFYDVISLIFHYHYQWRKDDEMSRNIAAIGEHLAYIDALRSGDRGDALECCRAHMATARKTLFDAISRSPN